MKMVRIALDLIYQTQV